MGIRAKDVELIGEVALAGSRFDELRKTFRGELITPSDAGYDRARQVWNAMVDHRPSLVARCRGAADVADTLALARDASLEVSVRGGAHSIVGHSVQGQVVIDLSHMRGVRVDPARRIAEVEGGAIIADLDREAQWFGLATTGGLVGSTGVGGLTLGGGYGWLARRFGLACDNLRSVELVTADGSVVQASADVEPDLFWAVRGAGANFGVVTRFEFDLHRLDHAVPSGDVVYGADDGLVALMAFRDVLATAPHELYLFAVVGIAGDTIPVPSEHHGRPFAMLSWAWLGDDPADAEAVSAPLHRAGTPISEQRQSLPYVLLQGGPQMDRERRRLYWKSSFLNDLSDEVLRTFLEATIEASGGRMRFHGELVSMGGAIAEVGNDATAYAHRSALVDFLAVTSWTDPADDDDRLEAGRSLWARVSDLGGRGVYVNNLGSEGEERVREAYGPAKYERLSRIKARFDPDNVFHHNSNIRPAA
jgi:FAD/FMN-containing dehydrogenase